MRLESNQQCQWREIYSLLGLPVFLHIHVLIVTLSIDYVNTISGSVGKCVLKHIDDISALIAWCGTNML